MKYTLKPTAISKGYMEINPNNHLDLEDVHEVNRDYSKMKLESFTVANSSFENCKFENMKIDNMCFGVGKKISTYINCSFDGSKFSRVSPGMARFVGCTFRSILIKEFFSLNAEFINCVFTGKLKKAVFNGSVKVDSQRLLGRTKNEFHGNDFSEMDFTDVSFRGGIDLRAQKFPNEDDYLCLDKAFEVLEKLKNIVRMWDDSETKKEVLITIEVLDRELIGGQKQLFIIRKDIEPSLFNLIKEIIAEE